MLIFFTVIISDFKRRVFFLAIYPSLIIDPWFLVISVAIERLSFGAVRMATSLEEAALKRYQWLSSH